MLTIPDCSVVIAGKGEYGPFSDGRTLPWAELATPDGEAIGRALVGARDVVVDASALPVFKETRATLRFEAKGEAGNFRLRLLGVAAAPKQAA
jgi:hypothetical protein